GDGVVSETLEAQSAHNIGGPVLGQKRQNRLPYRGAMHWVAGPDARDHAHRAGGLDFVDVDDARSLQNAQVCSLLGFGNQATKVRLGAVAQIVLLDSPIAEVEQAQAEAELAGAGSLHHAMTLQNHQKTVRGALVKLQGRGNLRQSQRHIALPQQIQYGKCPVQSLNFVAALRS